MTLIIPAGYAQCTIGWTGENVDGLTWVTTFGLGEPLGDDPVSLAAAAATIRDETVQHLIPLMDSTVVLRSVTLDGPTQSAVLATDVGGLQGMGMPPPNVALLVKKVTSRRGRRAQGRMFLHGLLNDGEVGENGTLTGSHLGTLQDAISNWHDDITTALSVPFVILQNSEGVSPPISPPPVVSSLQVDQLVATQRRRLRR